uniref:Retropepsin-like aspartic endopeptidase domain-containing protein n=1 Tax=uncultured bacterium Ak20-3 TaxID=798570 RepID=D9MX80_9BACT|nr:hypothetical protein AKSOIL_0349 [uncultured bacterium Ak20-3]
MIMIYKHDHSLKVNTRLKVEPHKALPIIGWREWVTLSDLGISKIKAKVDTGARTSALHAYDVHEYVEGHKKMVRFKVHPMQKDTHSVRYAKAEVVDKRLIRDSGGKVTLRPVIITTIRVGELKWEIELTLVNRDQMGFRMLLGRQALRGNLLVNPQKSYLFGKSK